MDINEKLKDIIAQQLKIDAAEIDNTTDIVDDLGADSLDIVEILMNIEEQFGVVIPDEEVPNLKNLCDLEAYIENNM